MSRLARGILILQLLLTCSLPLASWTASALGCSVQNLLEGESLRWIFTHMPDVLGAEKLPLAILFLSAIGMVQECGILKPASLPLWRAIVSFVALSVLLSLPALLPHSALLSVTGKLVPSPWFAFLPYALCLNIMIAAFVYKLSVGRQDGERGISALLTAGLRRNSLWLFNFILGHANLILLQLIMQS
ncbi:MAG: hypothetical protein KBT12_05565 [Bacteroidales bacterium]|nr:hypothetical protein [Candidatus Physcousia equi]